MQNEKNQNLNILPSTPIISNNNNVNNNLPIEKVTTSSQPLSPRSISDRLKQPKLQQKLNENLKAKSPEPPTPSPIIQEEKIRAPVVKQSEC